MKSLNLICALLALSYPGIADTDSFDAVASSGAAKLVLESLANDIFSDVNGAADELRDIQLADPGHFVDPAEAEKVLRIRFREGLSSRYTQGARQVLEHLSRPRQPEEVFDASLISLSRNPGEARMDDAERKIWKEVFSSARTQACSKQAETLAATVRPSENEFDTLESYRMREVLVRRLAENQKTAVFAENEKYISEKIVTPMMDEASRQRRHQSDIVRKSDVAGWSPETVAANVLKRLETELAEIRHKAKEGEWTYWVFPSVTNQPLNECVERLVVRHVAENASKAEAKVDEDALLKAVDEAMPENRFVKIFRSPHAKELTKDAMSKAESACPEGERSKFVEYALSRLDRKAIRDAVAARFAETFDPIANRARTAYGVQHSFVDPCGNSVAANIRRVMKEGGAKPELKDVIAMLSEKVLKEWEAKRPEVLGTLDEINAKRYAPLLPSVLKRIEEKAKSILESVKEKPQEEIEPPVPPEEKLPIEVPCDVTFDRKGRDFVISMSLDGTVMPKVVCDSDPDAYDKSFKETCGKLSSLLRKGLENHPAAAVRLTLVVRDKFIYCGTVEEVLVLLNRTIRTMGFELASDNDSLGWKK